MPTKKETAIGESFRTEIEVAVVLLGFVFVMFSIVLTMPNDVLTLVKQAGMTDFFGVPFVSAGYIISTFGLYSSFSLLGAVLFYLLFLKTKKEATLLSARSFLAFGLYLSIFLLVEVNLLIGARLVGYYTNFYMNPFSGLLLIFSTFATFGYTFALWVPWLYRKCAGWLKGKNLMQGRLHWFFGGHTTMKSSFLTSGMLIVACLFAYCLNEVVTFFTLSNLEYVLYWTSTIILGIILVGFFRKLKGISSYKKGRIILLGASFVSLALASITFFNYVVSLYNKNPDLTTFTFASIFKSILLASLFSFAERLIKFREDEQKTNT